MDETNSPVVTISKGCVVGSSATRIGFGMGLIVILGVIRVSVGTWSLFTMGLMVTLGMTMFPCGVSSFGLIGRIVSRGTTSDEGSDGGTRTKSFGTI